MLFLYFFLKSLLLSVYNEINDMTEKLIEVETSHIRGQVYYNDYNMPTALAYLSMTL